MKRSRRAVVLIGMALGAALLGLAGCTSPAQSRYMNHLNSRVQAGPVPTETTIAAGAVGDQRATSHTRASDEDNR